MENLIVELYAGDLWECQMIHTLLADARIESFIQNDIPAAYAGVSPTEQTVRITIGERDFEAAAQIVKQYLSNRSSEK